MVQLAAPEGWGLARRSLPARLVLQPVEWLELVMRPGAFPAGCCARSRAPSSAPACLGHAAQYAHLPAPSTLALLVLRGASCGRMTRLSHHVAMSALRRDNPVCAPASRAPPRSQTDTNPLGAYIGCAQVDFPGMGISLHPALQSACVEQFECRGGTCDGTP